MTETTTVLVTGGAGYIGSHAVLALRDAGFAVVVIDNLSTGFRHAVPDDVPFHEGEIADAELLDRIIADHGIGAVMHFAGSIIVPESVENPLKYYGNNTANSRTLIEAAVRGGVRHFIFSSTAAVYGMPDKSTVEEHDPTVPINPYGMSKLMTEIMLRDTATAHPLNHCVLRYFNVAGADPQGRTGQSTVGATTLVKVVVEAALGRRAGVSVFGTDYDTPDGTGVRDYIHVSDLAAAHVCALRQLIDDPAASLTLNCGYGRGFSVLEVLDAVERVSGVRIERTFQGRRVGDPGVMISENRRILETFSWQPRWGNLDTIITHALAWEKKLAAKR